MVKYQYFIDDTSDVIFWIRLCKRDSGDGNTVSGYSNANEKSYCFW